MGDIEKSVDKATDLLILGFWLFCAFLVVGTVWNIIFS